MAQFLVGVHKVAESTASTILKNSAGVHILAIWFLFPSVFLIVRHVTGTGSGLLGGIPRVVVQISALTLKGPL